MRGDPARYGWGLETSACCRVMDRRVQCEAGMHRLFFSIKRVHWMWQHRARRILSRRFADPVTPAQFNLLRTLFTYRSGIVRFKLAGLLGVAAPGVSRMVKKLETFELVERRRDPDDRRYVRVILTEVGREFVEEIVGYDDEYDPYPSLDTIVAGEVKEWFSSNEHHEVELDILDKFLIRARVRRGDRAIYPVPWHGGEILYGEPGTIEEPPPMQITVAA